MNASVTPTIEKNQHVDGTRVVEMVIVGAGFGGLGMGIRLLQQGNSDFLIIEKGDEVGGTWRENHYPGAACDVQSHMYSFSFAPKTDWTRRYAGWEEIHQYMKETTDQYNLRQNILFNTEVIAASFDESNAQWLVQLNDGSSIKTRFFVMASGPLHVPQIPKMKGIEKFKGKVFHSAQWAHDYDLTGKAVASIGTGGSAIQYVPEIAKQVKQLQVYQRTPAWVIPRDERRYMELDKKLFKAVPFIRKLHRARLYWSNESRVVPMFAPNLMKQGQKLAELFIRFQVKDKAVAQKLTPDYVMGCKRILISNRYYPTFNRPNVDLITDGIAEVKENSIVTKDGVERPVDCIIYGTGFVTDPRIYMKNFSCTGLAGRELLKDWKDGAESYLGISTHGYPNMFQLIGPNTTLGHNSLIFMIEAQAHYILEAIKLLKSNGADYMDIKPEVQKAFNEDVQRKLQGTVWQSGCVSWYQQDGGKNFSLWPGYTWRYWLSTRKVKAADYVFSKVKQTAKV